MASYRRNRSSIIYMYARSVSSHVLNIIFSKEHGCDYAMLIYCTEGKGYRILGKQYTVEKYQYIIIPPGIPYSFRGRRGRSMDYLLVTLPRGSLAINSCRRIRFRSLFCRMNIPVYKIGYGCLRRYIAVSPWDILKNI